MPAARRCSSTPAPRTPSRWPSAPRRPSSPRIASSKSRSGCSRRRHRRDSGSSGMAPDEASGGAGAAPSRLAPESQQWAIQRRIDDVFAKLGEKFGDLTGRVEVRVRADTAFSHIGGLQEAKLAIRGFVTALTDPELYKQWGITP